MNKQKYVYLFEKPQFIQVQYLYMAQNMYFQSQQIK